MTLNVSLTPQTEAFINETVSSGRYHSASEVVDTALRLFQLRERERTEKIQWLRQEIQKGLDSGPAVPITDEFWQELRNGLKRRDQADANQ